MPLRRNLSATDRQQAIHTERFRAEIEKLSEMARRLMYGNVAAHAWSPPNFHHSEEAAKAMADAKCCSDLGASASLNIETNPRC
jgi:hypothetical protein